MTQKILIIGACGQIGSELTERLRLQFGQTNVIASDITTSNPDVVNSGPFEIVDATNFEGIKKCIKKHNIDTVYLMAAMLSATGEKFPMKAWHLNMTSLLHVLNLAKEGAVKHVFWPSSIAVFGPTTPKVDTPQCTVMEPTTVYGISKLTGERWCEYYYNNYGVDVRSIRYPGIISWKTLPGGGTTDYAVDIFHKAIRYKEYDCFLQSDTKLPMMFMDDAIKATIDIMQAPKEAISVRSSYNLAATSFTPEDLTKSIQQHMPEFTITYSPDYRQSIADTWPQSIDDSVARNDWNWKHAFNMDDITKEMLLQLGYHN